MLAAGGQLIRYGLVGLVSTGLNFTLFVGGVHWGLHYTLSATIAAFVSMAVGYSLNRSFTFAKRVPPSAREIVSYALVFGAQYVLAMAGYVVLIGYFALNPSVAFVLNAGFVAISAFLLLRKWTFQGERRA
jgi:putative flippase GtrA